MCGECGSWLVSEKVKVSFGPVSKGMSTKKPYTIIAEESFIDKKDPEHPVEKLLVHVKLQDGLIKTQAFRKKDYYLTTRDRLITDWLKSINRLPA